MKTYRSKLNQFKNIDRFSPQQINALFGFHPAILAEILFRVLPELERRRAERLGQRPDRKRPDLDNDGRPREVTPLHKVLLTSNSRFRKVTGVECHIARRFADKAPSLF